MRFFHGEAIIEDLIRLKYIYKQYLDNGITSDDGVHYWPLHPKAFLIADSRKVIKQKMKDIDRVITYIKGDPRT